MGLLRHEINDECARRPEHFLGGALRDMVFGCMGWVCVEDGENSGGKEHEARCGRVR